MTASALLNAIGQIDDKYVMEFAHIRRQRISWRAVAVIAACLLLIAGAVFTAWPRINNQPQHNIIWADSSSTPNTEQFGIIKGHIQFSANLTKAMAESDSNTDLFAIEVVELTGAANEEVYEQVIRPLRLTETYQENGIIFASREQIETMTCPDDMSIVLTLAHNENRR